MTERERVLAHPSVVLGLLADCFLVGIAAGLVTVEVLLTGLRTCGAQQCR